MKKNHRLRQSVLPPALRFGAASPLAVVAGLGLLTAGPGWQFSKASAFPKPEPVYSDIPGLTSPIAPPVTKPQPVVPSPVAIQSIPAASPISKWRLNGIWDQNGGKLAVINKHVHRVGDEIEGYKIIRIEGEEVWFQGPKRKERLALEQHPTPPNSVPQ
jgi:hypothetical protein